MRRVLHTSGSCAILSAILLTPACLRGGFDPSAANAQTGRDATVDRGPIDSSVMAKPFNTPVAVDEINGAWENDDPSLTADMLEIYFCSRRTGGTGKEDIWRATRSSTSAPWSAPEPVAELNSTEIDTTVRVSADGLEIFFASPRPGGQGGDDLWTSTRASRSAPWDAPKLVSEINTAAEESDPTVSADHLTLVFSSTRSGGPSGWDLWISTRATKAAAWSTPTLLPAVNSSDDEAGTWLSADQLLLVVDSTRPGVGAGDFYYTVRSARSHPFGALTLIPGVNSADNEEDPWLSPDQRTIYFATSRSGKTLIYSATR